MITNKFIDNIIENNMSDYGAYVVLNRAIPDLRDATKPVHKRIIYAMHKEKATKFMKSATMSGKVMPYHPHGDTYPTMVGMAQKDAQLLPWLVGKGNFSQHTSRDLMHGSSRYTEIKLSDFTIDVLKDLNNHSIDFIPNYDGTLTIPEVLPVKFPTILHYCQKGIALGMASNIPSFNMNEISQAMEKYYKTGEKELLIPDFATGGSIVFNKGELEKINNSGKGTVRLRAKYKIEGSNIIITEIPYTTTREAIIDNIITLIKENKIKDILKVDDSTGLKGMSITLKCKKHCNLENLMNKLYSWTPLESTFSANMNVICDKLPKVMGVWDIIDKWVEWRKDCITRSYTYEINELKKKMHLYKGFFKITNCIEDVVKIIRFTKEELITKELMDKLGIDQIQAEYISGIRLKNLNEEFIERQIDEIVKLNKQITEKEKFIKDENNLLKTIIQDVKDVAKKYGQDRKTTIIEENQTVNKEDLMEEYNCRIVYTKNYIKKHLKQSDNHKVKEGEIIINDIATNNKSTLLVFTNKANRYKIPVYELEDLTPSAYGQFIPSLIQLEEGEEVIKIVSIDDSSKGYIVSVFENGKVAKVNIKSFMSNNKKLMNCFNTEGKLISIDYIEKDKDIFILSSEGKGLVFNTERINSKSSRNTQGNIGIKLNEGFKVVAAIIDVTKDDRFTIHTEKGKEIFIMLDDVSSNESKNWFNHLQGRAGNQGSFLYNTRSKNDLIISVEVD